MPPETFTVVTLAHPGAEQFDGGQTFRVERIGGRMLLPVPTVLRRVVDLAREVAADLVVLDPALPLGLIGPRLARSGFPYGVVLHGAEVAVPGRLPLLRESLGYVLRHADLAVCAGGYPEAEAVRVAGNKMPRVASIPPGVDVERFVPLDEAQRTAARRRFGVAAEDRVIVSVSRIVPRKGMDVLVDAAALLRHDYPGLKLLIGGEGRDRRRLEARAQARHSPARFLGKVSNEDLAALYGCADVFVMACRQRWGALEQEGFGIVFLEAAATGVPQIAGRSGGAHEAVLDGSTGFVLDHPEDPSELARLVRVLLDDEALRCRMGTAARERAVNVFDYGVLARRLARALDGLPG